MPNKCECAAPWYPDKVTAEEVTSTPGKQPKEYGTFKSNLPCHIISTGGDETFRGKQIEPHITHVVEMPWVTGITATMRLNVVGGIHKSSILNIEYVNKQQKKGTPPRLEIRCRELAAT